MGILIICLQDYVRILMGEVCMSIASGSWRVNDNTKTLSIWAFLNENKRIEIWLWSTYCFSCRITKSNPTVMMTFPYVAQTSVTTTTIVPVRTTLIRMIRLHDQMYPLPGWIIYRLYLWLFLTMAASVNVIFSSFVIDGNKFGYYRFFIYSFLLLIMENTLCIDTKRLSWLGVTSLSTKRQWLRNDDNQTFSFSYFLC